MTDHSDLDAVVLTLRVPEPAPADEVLAARRLLNAAITREQRAPQPRRRWVAAVSGVAAVVVALAVVVSITSVQAPSAQALLADLVQVATGQRPLDPAEGEFVYQRIEGVSLAIDPVTIEADRDQVAYLQPFVDERWYAADGSYRQHFVPGERQFFSDADRDLASRDPALVEPAEVESLTDWEPDPVAVPRSELPRDPALLRAALIDAFGLAAPERNRPVAVELVDQVGDLMVEHDAPPDLRAALLEVLAGTEELELVERGDGTFTVGVEYDSGTVLNELRLEYVFDQGDARLVEARVVHLDPDEATGIPPGAVSFVRYDAPVVVDELGP